MQFLKSLLILAAITSMANAADPDDNRWNNFQWEAQRARADGQRIAAEGQRIAAEGQRIAAQGQRIAAQGQRIAAECQRIGNWYHYPPFSMPSFGSSYAAPNNTSQEMTNQALQLRQDQERQEAEQREQREAQERSEFAEIFRQQQLLQQEEKAREERELQEALCQVEAFMEQERQQREAAEQEQRLKEEKPRIVVKDQDLKSAARMYKALGKELRQNKEARFRCLELSGMNGEYARAVDDKLINGEESETQEAIRLVEQFMEQERQQREAEEQKLKEEKPKLIIKDQDLIAAGEWYKALTKMDQMNKEARVKCLKDHGFSEEYAKAVDDKLIGEDSEED